MIAIILFIQYNGAFFWYFKVLTNSQAVNIKERRYIYYYCVSITIYKYYLYKIVNTNSVPFCLISYVEAFSIFGTEKIALSIFFSSLSVIIDCGLSWIKIERVLRNCFRKGYKKKPKPTTTKTLKK